MSPISSVPCVSDSWRSSSAFRRTQTSDLPSAHTSACLQPYQRFWATTFVSHGNPCCSRRHLKFRDAMRACQPTKLGELSRRLRGAGTDRVMHKAFDLPACSKHRRHLHTVESFGWLPSKFSDCPTVFLSKSSTTCLFSFFCFKSRSKRDGAAFKAKQLGHL